MAYPGQGKERISITDLIPCLSSISFFFLLSINYHHRTQQGDIKRLLQRNITMRNFLSLRIPMFLVSIKKVYYTSKDSIEIFVNGFIDMIQKVIYSTPFLICCYNIVAGILNVVWYPGEVASPLIIVGGSSAISYLFFAISYEERKLSLLSFLFNNIKVFLV